jgi:hypothetical protein
MNTVWMRPGFVRKLAWLALATALAHAAPARTVEETFKVLKTRTGTYTNATVTTKADTYIFVLHSRGMASVKINDLPLDVRQQLGYAAPAPKTGRGARGIVTVASRELNSFNQKIQPFEANWKGRLPAGMLHLKIGSEVFYTLLAILCFIYFFYCHCCNQICLKAHQPKSLLVWFPGLQFIPLLRAAGMSGWWFLAMFVPLLNIVGAVLWSLKIANARGKSVLVGILLMLPLTNVLAFLYLAFSSATPLEAPPRKFESMALETA